MNFNLDSIFVEWRAKVPNGVPNPLNDYHLVLIGQNLMVFIIIITGKLVVLGLEN